MREVFGVPKEDLVCEVCGEPAVSWRVLAYSHRKGNLLAQVPISGVTGAIIACYCKEHSREEDDSVS